MEVKLVNSFIVFQNFCNFDTSSLCLNLQIGCRHYREGQIILISWAIHHISIGIRFVAVLPLLREFWHTHSQRNLRL